MSAEHDRHFFDTFMIVLGALVAFTIIIYFLANAIAAQTQGAYIAENPLKAEQIAERLAPVATVAIAGQPEPAAAPAPAPAPARTAATAPPPAAPQSAAAAAGANGKSVYDAYCMACHALAVAGAPKFGDPDAWSPRIAKGVDVLYANSINGYQGEKGIMPPKGGFLNLSDAEVKAAVDYMVSAAQK